MSSRHPTHPHAGVRLLAEQGGARPRTDSAVPTGGQAALLHLSRQIGNRAVAQLMRSRPIQAVFKKPSLKEFVLADPKVGILLTRLSAPYGKKPIKKSMVELRAHYAEAMEKSDVPISEEKDVMAFIEAHEKSVIGAYWEWRKARKMQEEASVGKPTEPAAESKTISSGKQEVTETAKEDSSAKRKAEEKEDERRYRQRLEDATKQQFQNQFKEYPNFITLESCKTLILDSEPAKAHFPPPGKNARKWAEEAATERERFTTVYKNLDEAAQDLLHGLRTHFKNDPKALWKDQKLDKAQWKTAAKRKGFCTHNGQTAKPAEWSTIEVTLEISLGNFRIRHFTPQQD